MEILKRFFTKYKNQFKREDNHHAQEPKGRSAFSTGYDFTHQTRDLCVNCNFALEKKLSYCNQCGVSV